MRIFCLDFILRICHIRLRHASKYNLKPPMEKDILEFRISHRINILFKIVYDKC